MKKALHAILVTLAALPWAAGCWFFAAAFALTKLAHALWPEADAGNCWSFAGPRWVGRGGYMLVRPAEKQLVLKRWPILHVIWVKSLDPLSLEQFVPERRRRGSWLPWHTVYYKGKVSEFEKPFPPILDPDTKPNH